MEAIIVVLSACLFFAGCFIIAFVYDAAKYKAQAKVYEKLLVKAGLIDEEEEDDE